MARPNPLADPEFAKLVAQAFVDGHSRPQMCELFGVKDVDTITRWRRDPRVKAHAMKLIEDRILQITRKTDSTIAARLEHSEKLTVKELLDIRREYMGGDLRRQMEKADDVTVNEAMEALEANPELANELSALLQREGTPAQGA